MRSIIRATRRFILYLIALVLAAGYPLAAMADTQDPTTTTPDTTQQAPAAPDPAPTPSTPDLHYTYNPTTGHWDSEKWVFNPATGTYEASPTPPAPTIISAPTTTADPATDTSSTGTTKSSDTTATIQNNLNSDATSGNSGVTNNSAGGNATTGDAAAVQNALNVVNSSVTSGDNQKVATFTQNVMGDVNGDIMLYPMLLKAMLEAQAPANASTTLSAKDNLQVNNNITVGATSGNASVTGNTSAGNATSGSAAAVANVVNILNSMIASQQSFIGTINIYGNLNGDILIAPDFIPQMIANNAGSTNASGTQLSTQDSSNIVNNISAVAKSGAAAVFGNTSAGNATTGDANTGVVIFNLTGHQIIAKNSLLVFVNVLGKWVGAIVDAPAGATAALLGNDVTTNTQYTPDITVNSESTHGITNTVAVDAKSGDAVVSGNTQAGNATSGSAVALANVANLSNSAFGISDWFGVLFINVFQNWYGSFGVNTPYGDPASPVYVAPAGPVQFVPHTQVVKTAKAVNNTSTHTLIATASSQTDNGTSTAASDPDSADAAVLGQTLKENNNTPLTPGFDYRILIVAGSILAVGLSLLGLKKLFS